LLVILENTFAMHGPMNVNPNVYGEFCKNRLNGSTVETGDSQTTP